MVYLLVSMLYQYALVLDLCCQMLQNCISSKVYVRVGATLSLAVLRSLNALNGVKFSSLKLILRYVRSDSQIF